MYTTFDDYKLDNPFREEEKYIPSEFKCKYCGYVGTQDEFIDDETCLECDKNEKEREIIQS